MVVRADRDASRGDDHIAACAIAAAKAALVASRSSITIAAVATSPARTAWAAIAVAFDS